MYFQERMFNPTYVSRNYYNQIQTQIDNYNFQQNIEVEKAVKATHDLCSAVKKMDEWHQQEAFFYAWQQWHRNLAGNKDV